MPQHVAIIMDGNRRWAKRKGWPAWRGHEQGYQNLKKVARHAFDRGLKILTVYAFSRENWKRSKVEINFLLKLIQRLIFREVEEIHKLGVRLQILGDRKKFSPSLQRGILQAEKITAANKKGILNVCLNYEGREEIVQAVQAMLKQKKINHKNISLDQLAAYLDTAGQPDPDLIIRTSGEMRLSNFLTWQSVYSELYFSPKYWPDFSNKDFDRALREFQRRTRRFGA